MLKIKLAHFGKRNQSHFRIVVNEARDKRDGSYVALLGHYIPAQEPKILEIDVKAYQAWIAKGAQPTETVANLFERYQSKNPFPAKPKKPSRKTLAKAEAAKKAKAEEKPAEEIKTEQPAEKTPVEETPTEEKPVEAKPVEEAPTEVVPATEEK